MSDHTRTYALAAGMGVIAGMRSMSAPALLSRRLSARHRRTRATLTRLLSAPGAGIVWTLLAAGEAVADKTPFVPDRTEPPSLVGRALTGALCGAAIADVRGASRGAAALLAAAAAVGSAHVCYELRRRAQERSGLPNTALGLAEDALVFVAGARIADEAV